MKIISLLVLMTFLFTNIAYSEQTLRVSMGASKRAGDIIKTIAISEEVGRWVPVKELGGKILVDIKTGQIKFKYGSSPVVTPQFELWSVRHGASFGNEKHILQGDVNEPINHLSDKGKEQAIIAARELFEELGEDKIKSGKIVYVASGLVRSQQTADAFIELVREKLGTNITYIEESLGNEMSFGLWGNNPRESFLQDDNIEKFEWHIKWKDEFSAEVRPPVEIGGESFIDVMVRNKKLLEKFNREHKGKTIVVFDHGTCITAKRVLLGDMTMLNKDRVINWQKANFANAELRNLTNPVSVGLSFKKAGELLYRLFEDTSKWGSNIETSILLFEKMLNISGSREIERKALGAIFDKMKSKEDNGDEYIKLAELVMKEKFNLLLPDSAQRFVLLKEIVESHQSNSAEVFQKLLDEIKAERLPLSVIKDITGIEPLTLASIVKVAQSNISFSDL